MDGRLSKSQLGEDKEKQIKLENLIVEETKSVVTIDHWKKMLSMKAEAICSVNNEAGNSNMAATNPIDGELMLASLSICCCAVYGALFSPMFLRLSLRCIFCRFRN